MGISISPRLTADILHAVYRPWTASFRLTSVNRESMDALLATGQPFLLGLWHSECFTLISLKKNMKLMTIASQSRDGEYITGVLKHLGFVVARGSSSRGAVGVLRTCMHHMQQDKLIPAITMDGPRGPRHKAKSGILYLAQKSGAPIIFLRALPEQCFRFKSWDRFEVPLPFSKVRIVYSDPYYIRHETLDEEIIRAEQEKIESLMHSLEQV